MATTRRDMGVIVAGAAASVTAGAAISLWSLPALLSIVIASVAALTLFAPGAVALLGISTLYLNIPGIAVTVHGLPPFLAASTFLLLLAPFLARILLRREPVIVDHPLVLIVAFLCAVLLSSFVAQDKAASTEWMKSFLLEGLLTYFLALNLFRSVESLRHALKVLMLCGALLGGLTLYQETTGSYAQQFSGLAQRNIEYGVEDEEVLSRRKPFRNPAKIHVVERASGPIGGSNRYGQILLLLVPLVYFTMRAHRRGLVKVGGAVCGVLILAGMFLTYSRGTFVGFVAVLLVLTLMGGIRLRALAAFAGVAAIAVMAWAPGYVLRLDTLRGVPGIFNEDQRSETDVVILGRLTETFAAFNVFLDHPVVGVGPGQFLPVYSARYMNNPDISLRRITVDRRAHNLYFELAAETGLLGIVTFLAAVCLIQARLWRAWRRWRRIRPDLAGLAGGFFLSIVGYLVTALFLHLAYQRYYWLFLGLAGAALQVISREAQRSEEGSGRPAGEPAHGTA